MLCLLGAAICTLFTGPRADKLPPPAEQLALTVQRIPFEAQNALRGEASAFDALARSAAQAKNLHAAHRPGRCGQLVPLQ